MAGSEALNAFPLGKADEVVQAISAAYKAEAAALAARADAYLAEQQRLAAAGAKAASVAAEVARLEAEWKAAKAAKGWEGAKAAKGKFDEASAAAESAAAPPGGGGGGGGDDAAAGGDAAQIVADAEALVASAPLKLLPGLADVYSREADRKGEADDYDAAKAYAEAAGAVTASAYDLEVLAPGFDDAATWGPMAELLPLLSSQALQPGTVPLAALKAKVRDREFEAGRHRHKYLSASEAYPGDEHGSWTALPREVVELGRGVTCLDLTDCKQLRRLPLDLFDKLPGLGRLDLNGCESLDGPFPDPRNPNLRYEGFRLDFLGSSAACQGWALGLKGVEGMMWDTEDEEMDMPCMFD